MKNLMIGIIFLHSSISLAITIIGHRGAAGYAPENTLASFAKAIECKVDMIEFDVWRCASGELVVFHDAQLNPVTNGHGYITETTLHELKKLRVMGSSEQIPTLQEALNFINRRVKVYVEIKGTDIAHDVVNIIEYYVNEKDWRYDDFLVASFDHTQLRDIKAANKLISVAALFYGIPYDFAASATSFDADVVCVSIDFINQVFVDDIHKRGMRAYVYTVNHEDDILRVLSYNVNGIVTDYPLIF
jgi:glycerophosphoryl diester phosphodiesterase